MPYERGDVVLVLFPDSNLRTAKRRPALVVQAKQSRNETTSNNHCYDHQQHDARRP
jgi:mRNA-degrading endonuclease toxin of MazEF toxin-antitoxin module